MTRGKIIFIQGEMQVYTTSEFNGDMHPDRYGEEVLECFRKGFFQNYRNYERFVENLKNTCILSKKEFVDVMNRLREASDLQEQVNKLFRNSRGNIENDFCNAAALQISHESSVVFLLKRIMRDQYDYIEYFIYELDYGRKYEAGMITDEDGHDIDIHTPELLYDYISNHGVTCKKEV